MLLIIMVVAILITAGTMVKKNQNIYITQMTGGGGRK
jgi:uncharacterized membrane protein